MKKRLGLAAATLLSAAVVTPALAQEACISQKRMFSVQALDERTLIATDRQKNAYTIHMAGTCGGLWKGTSALGFHVMGSELSCIRAGDRITYPIPGAGRVSCYVAGVTAGAPAGGAS